MRERGISLAEVLVAITVLALALTISLVLYDGARRSFKVGNNLAEQQQVVRIAFDKLVRDVGLAGLNHNPDGTKLRPDEAIEAAYDTQIVVRADFDGDDPANADDPETSLGAVGGAFPSVSIGNDEIVGYVLAKADLSSPDNLDFEADVTGVPRDGIVEPLTVAGVALVQDDPPYTLYRVTIGDDSTDPQRIPLVDNVRSMRFTYYDGAGSVIPAPGGGEDEASRNARAAIRRIGVEIEGLTRDPDARWTDRADADPDTREYRKFALGGDVTPLNLGLFGMRDLSANLSPPTQPPPPVLHPGHCGGLYVEWSPNPPQDEVARYEIRYGPDVSSLLGPEYASTSNHYIDGLADATEYHVTVEAVDDSGNISPPSHASSAVTENLNEPGAPMGLSATSDLNGHVELAWAPVLENFTPSQPTADPTYPRTRDLDHYRIYRADTPGFTPSEFNRIDTSPSAGYSDQHVVNCRPYYYRVTASDACPYPGDAVNPGDPLGLEGDPSEEIEGRSFTTVNPAAPVGVQAFHIPVGVRLIWDPVTRDVDGNAIYTEDYRIYRKVGYGSYNLLALVPGATEYIDIAPIPPVSYKVQAYDSCPGNSSAQSEPAEPTCTFVGEVDLVQPGWYPVEVGDQIVVQLSGGSGSYNLTLSFLQSDVELLSVPLGAGPPWGPATWPASLGEPGFYRLRAIVQQSDLCTQTRSRTVWVDDGGGDDDDDDDHW